MRVNRLVIASAVGLLAVSTTVVVAAPPVAAAVTTVALVGDMACATTDTAYNGGAGSGYRCRQKAVSDLVTPSRITKVVTLGDNQYEDGAYSQFTKSYGPSFGRVKSKTLPTCGNHEYRSSSTASGYREYFGRSCKWYTTKIGTARFIMLDTSKSMAVGSSQYNFVRDTLNASGSTCIFLAGHHARYSSGKHGNDYDVDPIWDLGVSKGVTAMFSGHDHSAQRYKPRNRWSKNVSIADGMVQIISGAGGKSIYDQAKTSTGLVKYLKVPGVYEMAIRSTSVTLTYRGIDGRVHDALDLPCRRAL